ncbi:hypothetical protein [Xanthomonas theicola]|uniref:hypothetical protein n=1 Tax=Xanthomonas theicola TaxID=56464 RepID=UPI0036186504
MDLLPQAVSAEYWRRYPHCTPSQVFFAATAAGCSWRDAIEEGGARDRVRRPGPRICHQLLE